MKLKKSTWVVVAIAILLGGGIALNEFEFAPQREAKQAKEQKLFEFTEEEINNITIETKPYTIKLKQVKDKNYKWQIEQPKNVPAEDAIVSFLLDLLVDGKSERILNIVSQDLKEYGLEPPFATIKIELVEQTKHQINLGKTEFSEKFVYALKDSEGHESKQLEVLLVPIEFKYAVERDLEEWQQKPETTEESATEEKSEQTESEPESKQEQ